MRIVVGLTPGSADEPANATGRATKSAAARATTSSDGRLIFGASLVGALPRTRVPATRDQLTDSSEEAADAVRDDEHQEDQDDAVHDRWTAGLLRLLDDCAWQKRAQILPLSPERQGRDGDRAADEGPRGPAAPPAP